MSKVIICAEIGHNFNGDMRIAKNLIKSARDCGCDYAKVQLYDTDKIKRPGETNYDELERSELTKEQMLTLWKECKKVGIKFMASCFDVERLAWYMETEPTVHKVASRSIHDTFLIGAMQGTGLPIIASLGNWKEAGLPKFKADFLYCRTRRDILKEGMVGFPKKFDKFAGFSDHCIGIDWAKLAIDRGAEIIEKHYAFELNSAGWDIPSSANPRQMEELVKYAKG